MKKPGLTHYAIKWLANNYAFIHTWILLPAGQGINKDVRDWTYLSIMLVQLQIPTFNSY